MVNIAIILSRCSMVQVALNVANQQLIAAVKVRSVCRQQY
jgi:hypothetical protein